MSFTSVYHRNFPALYRYVLRWIGDEASAEDIAQEAFVRYLASSVEEEEARPWLFRVATNLVRDHRRRRTRRGMLVRRWSPGSEGVADPDAERSLEIQRVRRALDRLSDRDRQVLLMREEGFSYVEIAQAAGIAPASVGTVLRRALGRFRDAYEQS